MLTLRKSSERGHFNHEWLDTYHTFSFAEYYDPNFMGFSVLRVINEDKITGGKGFPLHGHRDMEIITIIVSGALQHRDTLGNAAIIRPGEVQRMTAGTGIRHSEMNALPDKPTHLMQIWIMPEQNGHTPGYEQKSFAKDLETGNLVLVASNDGRKGSVTIHQNAGVYLGHLKLGSKHRLEMTENRSAWVQVISGGITVNNTNANAGDGLAVEKENVLAIDSLSDSQVIIFDLPAL